MLSLLAVTLAERRMIDRLSPLDQSMLFAFTAVACGVAARSIADFRSEKNAERFYLAGILHDIGRLVLYKREPTLARDTLYRSKEQQENIYLSERELMGFDHADVGGNC